MSGCRLCFQWASTIKIQLSIWKSILTCFPHDLAEKISYSLGVKQQSLNQSIKEGLKGNILDFEKSTVQWAGYFRGGIILPVHSKTQN